MTTPELIALVVAIYFIGTFVVAAIGFQGGASESDTMAAALLWPLIPFALAVLAFGYVIHSPITLAKWLFGRKP